MGSMHDKQTKSWVPPNRRPPAKPAKHQLGTSQGNQPKLARLEILLLPEGSGRAKGAKYESNISPESDRF
jgi:hypothetical protein